MRHVFVRDHSVLTIIIIILTLVGGWTVIDHIDSYLHSLVIPGIIDRMIDFVLVPSILAALFLHLRMFRKAVIVASSDALTGIPNRMAFNRHQWKLIRKQKNFQLILMDLCKFKAVNDTYGHEVGDQVLKIVAERLRDSIGKDDFVARLGGDEFVLLLLGDPKEVVDRIIKAVKRPIEFEGKILSIGLSMGTADFPKISDVKTLMTKADCAMYNAKQKGIDIFSCHPGEGRCNVSCALR